MPLAVASYANDGITVCQSRTYSCYIKIEWWRPQPPPLHSIFRPTCHIRGRGSSHLSQRHFLHRAADLDDIDTVTEAAYAAVRAAVHAPAAGGIYLDQRRRCRAVAALDDYRAVNHLDRQPRPRYVGDAGLFHFLNIPEVAPWVYLTICLRRISRNVDGSFHQHLISKPRVAFQWLFPMAIHRGQTAAPVKHPAT